MIAVTDQLLDILKYALLGLLYLFFARVLWAVWSEVRGPRHGKARAATMPVTNQPYGAARPGQLDMTAATPVPSRPVAVRRRRAPARAGGEEGGGHHSWSSPSRASAAAPAFALGQEITIGRTAGVHDHDPRRLVRLPAARPRLRAARAPPSPRTSARRTARTSTASG